MRKLRKKVNKKVRARKQNKKQEETERKWKIRDMKWIENKEKVEGEMK